MCIAQGRLQMFDFNQDLNTLADSANTKREVRKGTYGFRVDSVTEGKTQTGAPKYEVACTIVAQADKLTDLVGVTRKQHFVHGHAKPEVAKNYEKAFLAFLKACGVDLSKVKNLGDLYVNIKAVEAAKPTLVYAVAPQEKDAKYLDWTLVKAAAPNSIEVTATAPAKAPVAPVSTPVPAPAATVSDDELFG